MSIVQTRIANRDRAATYRAKMAAQRRPPARVVDAAVAQATRHVLAEQMQAGTLHEAQMLPYLDRVGFVALVILTRRGFDSDRSLEAIKSRVKPKLMPSAP